MERRREELERKLVEGRRGEEKRRREEESVLATEQQMSVKREEAAMELLGEQREVGEEWRRELGVLSSRLTSRLDSLLQQNTGLEEEVARLQVTMIPALWVFYIVTASLIAVACFAFMKI